VIPKSELSGRSIADLGTAVQQVIASKPGGQAGALEPHEEGSLRGVVIRGTYNGKTVAGAASTMQQISIALEYPDWFAILNYYAPERYFQQFLPAFRGMADAFHHTGR
jgi:hypothetical protein